MFLTGPLSLRTLSSCTPKGSSEHLFESNCSRCKKNKKLERSASLLGGVVAFLVGLDSGQP